MDVVPVFLTLTSKLSFEITPIQNE